MTALDPQTIQRSKEGDKEAFRCIVQHYQRMVFSLALKLVCNEEDAKDLVQDTFLKVWLNIKRYDAGKSFATWIYTIAVRLCLDQLKGQKQTVAWPEDESLFRQCADMVLDQQRELENREWIAIVRTLTAGLSEKQKLVFTLCQLEGLDVAEVKQMTGMNAIQIKSNLYVARQTIKKRLKQWGYEE